MGLSVAGMPVEFRSVVFHQADRFLRFDFSVEDGVFAGIIGPEGSGKRMLLRLASGDCQPDSGEVLGIERAVLAATTLTPADPRDIRREVEGLLARDARILLIGPALTLLDEEYRQYLVGELHRRQRQGTTILMATHDLAFVEQHCDEALLLDQGRVAEQGEARRVVAAYRKQVFERLRVRAAAPVIAPAVKHGDGRAVLHSIRIVGRQGGDTSLIESGEPVTVSVGLRFKGDAVDPVCGILIRSRVGITVYGTNTEQENLHFGPCRDGDEVEAAYRFNCNLCPGEYTITAASHDPDGTAHEWLEEAVLFTVTDTRYTTGVANLRASVNVQKRSVPGQNSVRI
jgi:lipopolysaccharide transport system ATP-binding protein